MSARSATAVSAADGYGRVLRVRRDRIRRFTGQPREHFDEGALRELAKSIKAIGQQVPVTLRKVSGDVRHDYELVDGERRWRACKLISQETLLAWVRDDVDDPAEQFVASVVANFSREAHTPLEVANAIGRIRMRADLAALPRQKQAEVIAEMFGRHWVWVYQHERLLGLERAVQRLLSPQIPKKQRLTMEIALCLLGLPAKDQVEVAQEITVGRVRMRSGRAKALIRKRARGETSPSGSPPAHQPARLWRRFTAFVHRLSDDLDVALGMSQAEFREGFASRDGAEQRHIVDTIDSCLTQLSEMRQVLARLVRSGGGALAS